MTQVSEIVTHFKNGDIVVYPTDTVWGVGCVVSDLNAVQKLSELKNRGDKPFTILVSSLKMAQKYGEFSETALKLAQNFWPGGLTLIVPFKPESLTDTAPFFTSNSTIALRVPKLPLLTEVLDELGEGIAGPSANFAGEPAPATKNLLNQSFAGKVDFIVDSDFESSGDSSTIVDTTDERPQILRAGAVSANEVLKVAF